MQPFAFAALAQSATSFSHVREIDWTLNFGVFVVLALGLGAVYFGSVRAFERAVDGACAGKPVGVRDAYNRFWTALALAVTVAAALGVFVSLYPIQALFIAG